jgi:LPS export ABC transporter protein LptC
MRSKKTRQTQQMPVSPKMIFPALFCVVLFCAACSFNYDTVSGDDEAPDLIMKYAEYVRIENGNPVFKVNADEVRRYEVKHSMELDNFFFFQYNAAPEGYEAIPDINVRGSAGNARIETDTNNFFMEGGVYLEIKSEDITLETGEISWQDKEKQLNAPGKLNITRSDGTSMGGLGFTADIRRKTWEFESDVEGSIVDDDSGK